MIELYSDPITKNEKNLELLESDKEKATQELQLELKILGGSLI